jgi:hypothetical protein
MDRSLLVRRVAPVAVFAAVLGGVVALNHKTAPPLKALPLAASGAGARDSAAAAPAASGLKVRPGYGAQPHVADALLDGLPDHGPVYALGGADDAAIVTLARALGVAGDVRSDAEGRYVGTGDRVLRVSPYGGLPWYYGGARDVAVSSGVATPATAVPDSTPSTAPGGSGGGSASGSAGGSPGTDPAQPPDQICASPATDGSKAACEPRPYTPPKPPPAPSDAEARHAAAPVFAALGLDGVVVTVDEGWGTKSVAASPLVGGLPTSGYETRVEVDVHGDVVSGNGFLGALGTADSYPLLGPRESIARGGAYGGGPVTLEAPCDATTGCPTAEPNPPREVSRVRLGLLLMSSYDSAKAFLTPAWLLSFDGEAYDEPVLALPDRYLEPAPTAKPDGAEPNRTDPGTAGPGDQVPPASAPPAKP